MASQGPLSPGTISDNSTVGTVAWSNPDNAMVSDNVYTTAVLGGDASSHYLKATNFGFSIPDGSTINGIKVEIEAKAGIISNLDEFYVYIVKNGTIGTENHAGDHVGYWPTTESYLTFGGSSTLWGETWTVSDINASTFGVVISTITNSADTAYIDHVRITVYYTGTSTTSSSTSTSTSTSSSTSSTTSSSSSSSTSTSTSSTSSSSTSTSSTTTPYFNIGEPIPEIVIMKEF